MIVAIIAPVIAVSERRLKRVTARFPYIGPADLEKVGACRQVATDSEIIDGAAIVILGDRTAILLIQHTVSVRVAGGVQLQSGRLLQNDAEVVRIP